MEALNKSFHAFFDDRDVHAMIKPRAIIAGIIPAIFIVLLLALLLAKQMDSFQKHTHPWPPLSGAPLSAFENPHPLESDNGTLNLDEIPSTALLMVFLFLLAVAAIACSRAMRGSRGTMVFLWALASLLSGLYLLSLRSFPFDSYLSELTVAALVFAVVGNLLLGFWLSQLKGRYVAQGKAIVMKQNLLAIAAHELRTPITNLRSQADLALAYIDGAALGDARGILQMSLDDLDTLDHHIKSILALAALENGTLKSRKDWFAVAKMCNELNGQFAGTANVALIWDCVSDPRIGVTEVYSDYDLIKVVVRNAIENAFKHTSDGFVKISMSLRDKGISISVRDTGAGMSTAEMNALQWHKDPLSLGIRRGKDGWGIGMPVMKKFSEFLGGRIRIDSKPGFGTCLTIDLPVDYRTGELPKQAAVLPDHDMDHEPGSIRTSESGDQKTKVLLIDDNHTFLKQMQRFFAPKILGIPDVELTVCGDPVSGITRLEEQRFDLLLVDFHMPHVDGLKLLEWLASHEHPNQEMVKIMLTADPSIPERKRAAIVAAGARIVSKGMPIEDMKILVAGVKEQKVRNQAQIRAAVELTAI